MRARQPIQTLSFRSLVLTWNKNNIGFDSVHDPSVLAFREGEEGGRRRAERREVESEISVGRSVAVAALMTGSGDEEGAAGGSHAARGPGLPG